MEAKKLIFIILLNLVIIFEVTNGYENIQTSSFATVWGNVNQTRRFFTYEIF